MYKISNRQTLVIIIITVIEIFVAMLHFYFIF